MEKNLSDRIGLFWLESTRTLPTRALQLSFERAQEAYGQLNDFSIILSILKNNPSIVPSDAVPQLNQLLGSMNLEKAKFFSEKNQGKGKYNLTIDPLRRMLSKYLQEKAQGLHQYASAHDCSLELVATWIEELKQRPSTMRYAIPSEQEIVALGNSDYLRLSARVIEQIPGRVWHSASKLNHSALWHSLSSGQLTQKAVAKILKKLSSQTHLNGANVPEHQDMILMLNGGSIRIRPASFNQEARWHINKTNGSVFGSVHNLLEKESPVHCGLDPIVEFEDLLNTPSASEHDFQRFFERNPRFLLGTDYSRFVSQPVLVRNDESDLIPDFILIPHDFARPVIVDLKLPHVSIARHKNNREGFLQSVMEARDQLLEYKNYFSSKSIALEAKKRFGCELYFPRMAVIIGRTSSFLDDYERRKIESRTPDIDVMTYDDIYRRAVQCRNIGLL